MVFAACTVSSKGSSLWANCRVRLAGQQVALVLSDEAPEDLFQFVLSLPQPALGQVGQQSRPEASSTSVATQGPLVFRHD